MSLTDATLLMRNSTHVLYSADPSLLKDKIEEGFALTTFNVHGYERALVSVLFSTTTASFDKAPFLRSTFEEMSYRTYVRKGREQGVYFFAQQFDEALFAPGRWLGIRWERAKIVIDAVWEHNQLANLEMMSLAKSGNSWLSISGDEDAAGYVFGSSSDAPATSVVFEPQIGWMPTRKGRVMKFVAEPQTKAPLPAKVKRARFGLLEELGLVTNDQDPIACFCERRLRFHTKAPWFEKRDTERLKS